MFLSNASVRRPVAMGCLVIGLVFLGVNAFRGIPLEFLPRIDAPWITVVAIYPGASPKEIESDVVRPIEDAISTIEGVKHIQSTAMENIAQLAIEFELDRDVDAAGNDVREKVDLVLNQLPEAVEKPRIIKIDINAKPVATLALTGEVPIDELYDFADETLSSRLSVIAGVADVQLIGGTKREVHVLLDRERLAAHGLTAMNVVGAIQSGLVTTPAGRVEQGSSEYSVKFDGEYRNIEEIGALEVSAKDGARIHLRDVGAIAFAQEEDRQAAFVDGKRAIAVRVVKKSDANAATVVERVKNRLEDLRAGLPGGMDLVWVTDDGAFIQASADGALSSILQAIGLTALILLLFLVDLRTTIVVAVTMPVTYIASVFFLRMMDFTLNVSTLLSIGLSVGVLVTNSIVVIERIVGRLHAGDSPAEAARLGTGDVALAVLASAGTNIVVLFPIAVMGGMVGKFLAPFATTMVIVTAVSLFISFTLTPLLASKLLKPYDPKHRGLFQRAAQAQNRSIERLSAWYGRGLGFFLRHRWAIVLFLAVVLAGFPISSHFAAGLGFTLVPDSDRGEIFVSLEYPARTNLDATLARVHEVEQRLAGIEGLRHRLVQVGKIDAGFGRPAEGVFLAQVLLRFTDKTEREADLTDLVTMVRHAVGDEPGALVTIGFPGIAGGQDSPLQVMVRGDDLATLEDLATRIKTLAEGMPDMLRDIDTSVRAGKPELRVRPRRAVLSDLQLSSVQIGATLRANLAGLVAGSFKEGARSFDIRVKLAREPGKRQVAGFVLPVDKGNQLVPLETMADIVEETAPVQVNRRDKSRISAIYASTVGTTPLGTAAQKLAAAIDENIDMPPGYEPLFVGRVEAIEDSNREFGKAILIALVLTFLLLAAILESFAKPWLILVTVPLAFIGVLLGLVVSGQSISVYVTLGVVMLMGIVVNNAILVMERHRQLVDEGVGHREAMVRASADQLRPIVMITLAAVLGMLPLALGGGLGDEPRIGIGAASVGGVLVSGVLTLGVLPGLYLLFTRKDKPAQAK